MSVKAIVMRFPVLQEDEGRHTYVHIFDTREEALTWVASQEGKYFKPGDYYIARDTSQKGGDVN